MCNKMYLIVAVAVLALVAAQAFAVGTPDYNNIVPASARYRELAGTSSWVFADDVHRNTTLPIVQIDVQVFGYRGGDVDIYVWENTGEAGGYEASVHEPVIIYNDVATVTTGHGQLVSYVLPAPLAVSANLVIGVGSTSGEIAADTFDWIPSNPGTIGVASHTVWAQYNMTGNAYNHKLYWNDETSTGNTASMGITTYTAIPEPGSLLALGTGLIGLVGLGFRRRR